MSEWGAGVTAMAVGWGFGIVAFGPGVVIAMSFADGAYWQQMPKNERYGSSGMRTQLGLALAAAVAVPIAGCGTNATTPFPQEQILTGQMVNQSDANSATESYRIVQLDNQEGQLAAAQSADPQVRALAAELIGKANQLYPQLETQLQRTGITPARVLPRELQGKVDRLRALRGRAFDRQYLADQIDSHQRAIAVFQDGLARSQDAGIKAQLTQAIPVVQDSLDKLQALKAKIG